MPPHGMLVFRLVSLVTNFRKEGLKMLNRGFSQFDKSPEPYSHRNDDLVYRKNSKGKSHHQSGPSRSRVESFAQFCTK